MANPIKVIIEHGMSKDHLLAQLADIGRVKDRPVFKVMTALNDIVNNELHLIINGIVADDGSGNQWLISGYVVQNPREPLKKLEGNPAFEGYFDTRTRRGYLNIQLRD